MASAWTVMRRRERNLLQRRSLGRNPGSGRRGQRRCSGRAGRGERQQRTGGRGGRTVSPDCSWLVMTIRTPRTHQRVLTNQVCFWQATEHMLIVASQIWDCCLTSNYKFPSVQLGCQFCWFLTNLTCDLSVTANTEVWNVYVGKIWFAVCKVSACQLMEVTLMKTSSNLLCSWWESRESDPYSPRTSRPHSAIFFLLSSSLSPKFSLLMLQPLIQFVFQSVGTWPAHKPTQPKNCSVS